MSSRSASALLDAALAVPFDPEEEDRRRLELSRQPLPGPEPVGPSVVDIAPEVQDIPPAPMQIAPDPIVAAADAAMLDANGEPPLPVADEDLPPVVPPSGAGGSGARRSAAALLADVADEPAAAAPAPVRSADQVLPEQVRPRRSASVLLAEVPEESSMLRRAADVPVFIMQGATTGLKALADVFGADSPASQQFAERQAFWQSQLSPEAQASQQRVAQIQQAAQDQGLGAQVAAAGRAFAESPTAFVAQGLGTMAPTVATGGAARLFGGGAAAVQAAQLATGAAMGGGIVKGEIYQAVEQAMLQAGRSPQEAASAAAEAQAYGGENLDQILAGYGLGAFATAIGAERLAGRAIAGAAAPTGGVLRVAGRTALQEALPEAAQGGQEQLARNLAQQREGFEVPTMRGVAGAGALEGLAGLAIGGPAGVASSVGSRAGGQPAPTGVQAPWQAAREQAVPTVTQVEVVDEGTFGEPTTAAVERPVATGDERFAPPAEAAAPAPAVTTGEATNAGDGAATANPYRTPDGQIQVPFRASSNFDPTLQEFEDRMRAIVDDPATSDAAYDEIPDSKSGKVIGTDIYRNVLPEYAQGREGRIGFVNATGRVAQAAAKDRLWREINNRGDRKVLLFTAGGVAAGKSTAVTDDVVAEADLVFDGTLRETDWAKQTIQQALDNGWEVEVRYVQRPLKLVARGAIRRAQQEGRWGPYASVPETHAGAQRSMVEIAKTFEGNPNARFKFYSNEGTSVTDAPKVLSLKDIDTGGKYSYATSDERVSQRQDRSGRPDRRGVGAESQQPSQQGQESGGGSPFAWRVRGYSPAEHLEIFREAARSGDFEPRILRLLAAGNPALEQVVAEVAPTQTKRNIQRKLRPDAGAVDLSIVEDLVEYGRTIYRTGMDYATWAAAMTREFGQAVAQFLRQAFDRIVAAYQASRFSDTTGAVGDVRPKAKPRQFEAKARQNEALAPETRARLGSEYIPISLNAQAEAAKEWINTNGLEAAKLRIAQLSGNDTVPTPVDFAIGIEAAGRLSATGDHAGAAGIVSTMSQRATSLGQTISVLAMMARLTPEGIVLYGQNIVSRYINTLPQEAQDRIKALQAEVDRLRTALAEMKFKEGSEVIRSGKLGDEKIQDRIKRRVKARVQADLGPAAAGPEVTAETKARTQGLNRQVREVLLSDAKQSEMTKEITQILTSQGNMPAAEAEAVAKSIVGAFTKIVTATRRNYVQAAKRNAGGRKGNFDKLLKMLAEQKDMTDAEFLGQVSRLMGVPGMTAEMARELKALGQRFESTTDPDMKQVFGAMMFEKAHELVPADFWVKVRAWTYLAQLFFPTTWIRNILGNTIQWIADVGRDASVTTIIDPSMALLTGKRTSVGLNLGPRLKGLATPYYDVKRGYMWSKQQNPQANFFKNFKEGVNHLRVLSKLTTQNKFEITDVRNVGGRIFSSNFMRLWESGLGIVLGAGDRAFWMSAFKAALAKMERAAIANGEWTGQPTPEMIEAAMAEAAYAIYQNENVLSKNMNKIRGALNRLTTFGKTDQYGVGTNVIMFTQVPGSLSLRGLIDWSPLGFISALYRGMAGILYSTTTGRIGRKFDQAAFNKEFTQALLGSGGFYAAGYYLYALGVITASREDDDDLEAMRRASGTGAYRINLTALGRALWSGNWFTRQEGRDGDLIVPYDWAQPVAITVAAGAELAAQVERNNREQLKKGLAERAGMAALSLVAGAKSLEELPMLSGLSSFMKTWGYGGPLEAITATVAGMPSQFLPQMVRKATQLNDNMIRETRGGDSTVQREFMKVLANVPGYSTKFPLRFDITGQAIQRYQYGGNNVLNVFLSPAMASEFKRNPVLQEVSRLVDATGDAGVVPRQVKRSATINGVKVDMTNEQLAAYQYYLGNFTMSHFAWRMAAPVYARLPDEMKVKMLAQDITDIDAAVKSAVLGHDPRRLTRNQMFLRQALVNSPLGQSVPPR